MARTRSAPRIGSSHSGSRLRTPIRLRALVRSYGGREVWQGIDADGQACLCVRARNLSAWQALRREAALMREWEDDAISAAPRLLSRSFASYCIEQTHELSFSYGRRMSIDGAPTDGDDPHLGAADLTAKERVRADLLDLLSELHTRSLTLNLAGSRGVGFRADGSVVVTDLSHISAASFTKVRADTRWVDQVVAGHNAPVAGRKITRPGMVGEAADVRAETARSGGAPVGAGAPSLLRRGWVRALAIAVPVALIAVLAAWALGVGDLRGGGEAEARSAGAATQAAASDGGGQSGAGEQSGAGGQRGAAEADPLADPHLADPTGTLLALADLRHDYLVGDAATNEAVVPESSAAREDAALRETYAHGTLTGGSTTVHDAEVLSLTGATATVRARVSESAASLTVEGAESTPIPAGAERTIVLTLERSGETWQISDVERAEDAEHTEDVE
ncbi:MAG: hypothetical protein Q4G21_04490 [Dermabacter sp.]|nr:hypothetical protein [Dermabacter sp.]